eukprot:6881225-Lingulodinium_polyedra.AAC.1
MGAAAGSGQGAEARALPQARNDGGGAAAATGTTGINRDATLARSLGSSVLGAARERACRTARRPTWRCSCA